MGPKHGQGARVGLEVDIHWTARLFASLRACTTTWKKGSSDLFYRTLDRGLRIWIVDASTSLLLAKSDGARHHDHYEEQGEIKSRFH